MASSSLTPSLSVAITGAGLSGLCLAQRLRDAFKLTFEATPDGGRQMDRQVLRAILLAGLEDRVHYGRPATAVEDADGEGLVLRFGDGTAVRAGVVVGADGIGSALRGHIMPGAEAPTAPMPR